MLDLVLIFLIGILFLFFMIFLLIFFSQFHLSMSNLILIIFSIFWDNFDFFSNFIFIWFFLVRL
jgi:hypothetical protein